MAKRSYLLPLLFLFFFSSCLNEDEIDINPIKETKDEINFPWTGEEKLKFLRETFAGQDTIKDTIIFQGMGRDQIIFWREDMESIGYYYDDYVEFDRLKYLSKENDSFNIELRAGIYDPTVEPPENSLVFAFSPYSFRIGNYNLLKTPDSVIVDSISFTTWEYPVRDTINANFIFNSSTGMTHFELEKESERWTLLEVY